jgi:pimeloyl-ACP methyl ester carboxylesterase
VTVIGTSFGGRVAAQTVLDDREGRISRLVLMDALARVYAEWNNKAVAFVSYGVDGGVRAVGHAPTHCRTATRPTT